MAVDTGEVFAARYRLWRRALFLGALAVLLEVPLDLRYPQGRLVVVLRVAWCLALVVGALVVDPLRPRLTRVAMHAAAGLSAVALVGIVAFSDGSSGPRIGFVLAFPLIVMVLIPDQPWLSAIAGAVSVAGGSVLLLLEGRGAWWLVEWLLMSGIGLGFAVFGAHAFRRTLAGELRAERAQVEAQRLLVESERQRGQVERLALAGRIAAGVAHEINNPLSFVKANLRFIREAVKAGGEPFAEACEAADETLEGVERIVQIVADLRGFSREGVDPVGPCDLERLAREALRLVSGRLASTRLTATFEPGLPPVSASARLLVQALVNLLANAADATAEQPPENRWIALEVGRDPAGLHLRIEDGGPGLSDEVQRHLFQPFFSTKGVNGTGLGLALTREQVLRCGGSIEGSNRPEGGSVFTIHLSACDTPATQAAPT